jgi:hypothetical protein
LADVAEAALIPDHRHGGIVGRPGLPFVGLFQVPATIWRSSYDPPAASLFDMTTLAGEVFLERNVPITAPVGSNPIHGVPSDGKMPRQADAGLLAASQGPPGPSAS